jgi:ABC transporter transmembrane region
MSSLQLVFAASQDPGGRFQDDPFKAVGALHIWLPAATLVAFLALSHSSGLFVKRFRWFKLLWQPFVSQAEADEYLERHHKKHASKQETTRARQRQGRLISTAIAVGVCEIGLAICKSSYAYASSDRYRGGSPQTDTIHCAIRAATWLGATMWLAIAHPATAPELIIFQSLALWLAALVDVLSALPQILATIRGQAASLGWLASAGDLTLASIFMSRLLVMPVAEGGFDEQVSSEEKQRHSQALHIPPKEYESMVDNYKSSPTSPEDYTTFFSAVTYRWMEPIQQLATKRALRPADVWKLRSTNDTGLLYSKYRRLKGSLLSRILRLSAHDAALDALWKIVGVTMNYAAPALSKRILECIEAGEQDSTTSPGQWSPRLYAFALAVCALLIVVLRFIAELINYHQARQVGLRIRLVLTVELFDKVLRRMKLNQAQSQETDEHASGAADIGTVVNFIATDINNLLRLGCDLHSLYGAPIEIVVATLFLYSLIGKAALVGVSILVLAIPINYFLGQLNASLQSAYAKARDQRILLTTEFVSSARYVKAQGIGPVWSHRINAAREEELRRLWRSEWFDGLFSRSAV